MDIYEEKRQRAETYRLFAEVFLSPPSDEVIESLNLYYVLEVTEDMDAIREDFESLLRQLPPYESLNNNYTNALKKRDNVHNFYLRVGLLTDEDLGLPPDHIGVEMIFMSYLIEGDLISEQREFLEKHLLNWAPRYLDMVALSVRTKFYKDIAELVKGFLISDYEGLFG